MTKSRTKKIYDLVIDIVKETYSNWREDRTLRLGAGLAYYGIFAIVPVVTLMAGIAAYFFSSQEIQEFIIDGISNMLGSELASDIEIALKDRENVSTENNFSSLGIFGVASLIIAASFIFVALQDALNAIWENPVQRGWRKMIKRYLWAYLVVLITSSMLFISLVIHSASSLAKYLLPGEFEIVENLSDLIFSMGSWVAGIFILALIFKLLIHKTVSWKVLLLGSAVTTFLIVIGTWVLSYYISNFASQSLTGAVGGIFLVLIWIYYEAQILLVGAQLTKTISLNNDCIEMLNLNNQK